MRKILEGGSPAWAIVSQGTNSLSNILLAIFVARAVSPEQFGSWSVAYAAFTVSYAILRALCSTPILTAREADDLASLRDGVPLIGVSAGTALAACMAPALLVPSLFQSMWPFLVIIPFIGGIDTVRSLAYRVGKNHVAALTDGIWLILQCSLFVLASIRDSTGVTSYTLAWGISGLVAAVSGWLLLGVRPSPLASLAAWRQVRAQAGPLAIDQLLISVRTQATPVVLALVAGYAATGALRAGMTLMGVLNALIVGLTPLATIYAVRRLSAGTSPSALLRNWSLAILAIGLLNAALLLSLPDAWGVALLGENWQGASSVLLPLALHGLLRGPISGAPIILKSQRRMRDLLRLRARVEPVALATPVAGAIFGGATGAAWGYVAGAIVTAIQSLLVLTTRRNPLSDLEEDSRE